MGSTKVGWVMGDFKKNKHIQNVIHECKKMIYQSELSGFNDKCEIPEIASPNIHVFNENCEISEIANVCKFHEKNS